MAFSINLSKLDFKCKTTVGEITKGIAINLSKLDFKFTNTDKLFKNDNYKSIQTGF